MISYRIQGGKQLHVLNRDKVHVQKLHEGDELMFEVDYSKGLLSWIVNQSSIATIE